MHPCYAFKLELVANFVGIWRGKIMQYHCRENFGDDVSHYETQHYYQYYCVRSNLKIALIQERHHLPSLPKEK